MNDERLPIKFIFHRGHDITRVEGGGDEKKKPNWVYKSKELILHSKKLHYDFSQLYPDIRKKFSNESKNPYVLKINFKDEARAKSHRKKMSNFFSIKGKINLLGLPDITEILLKINNLEEVEILSNRLKDYEKNDYALSCLNSFEKFEPIFGKMSDEKDDYKIKLIDFIDEKQNKNNMISFESGLQNLGINFYKIDFIKDLFLYELIDIEPQVILDSLNEEFFSGVYSVQRMPVYSENYKYVDTGGTIEVKNPDQSQNYLTIGILDSGISPISHLNGWIVKDKSIIFHENENDYTHGTAVAGVCLYGDELENKFWINNQNFKLLDSRIITNNKIKESAFIKNFTKSIDANNSVVKIWNLSSSIEEETKLSEFSDCAMTLDEIQDKYNVLIIKSAGNCNNYIYKSEPGKIFQGADSIRSLTVGSIAHEKREFDFSEVNERSPFSRIGPGPSYIIKPDVVHYGGNSGLDSCDSAHYTGIKTFSPQGEIVEIAGTSFSTPRITSLAASLYGAIGGDFDPLLLKTLIVHSASFDKSIHDNDEIKVDELGFGLPESLTNILGNTPNEITLILRDSLAKGRTLDILDFPMPECLIKDGFYTGQIIITLVYKPYLEKSQNFEYCQSDMDVKFGTYDYKYERDTERKMILNPIGRMESKNILSDSLFSKKRFSESENNLRERILISYKNKYNPVKKYAIDLEELTPGNGRKYLGKEKKWFLYLKGIYRDFIINKAMLEEKSLSQEYCLAITIRDSKYGSPVYNNLLQKLNEFNFVHQDVVVRSDIKISM